MRRPCHFEIHADNPERAIAFYTKTLGWSFSPWDGTSPYWLITTGPDSIPGINGGLLPRSGLPPAAGHGANAFVITVDVPSVDAYVAKALAAGGRVAEAKMPIPGVGWLAYIIDTEGNTFGLMQADTNAK